MFFLLLLEVAILFSSCNEPAPQIEWQKTYGGSLSDRSESIIQTNDGGFLVVGSTESMDGDVPCNHGFSDYWILKLDAKGAIQWQKCFGGSYYDNGQEAVQTSDSGYLIAGHAYSYDGDVHGNHGRSDEWILKLSKDGNLQWQKTLGGVKHDFFNRILPAAHNRYIIIGSRGTANGADTLQEGFQSTIVDEIDEQGNVLWEKNYSSLKPVFAGSITRDGYLFAGSTIPNDAGAKSDEASNHDFEIMNIDTSGNLLWQGNYGGKKDDVNFCSIPIADGNYLIAGITGSTDGEVTGNHGNDDIWVIEIDSTGKILWQHCYGGMLSDKVSCAVQMKDQGFIICGTTSSLEGDVRGNHGLYDCWLIKINASGKLIWQKCLGGSGEDEANDLVLTRDSGIVMLGNTQSHDGNVTFNHGSRDIWLVKLKLN